jgi:predicted nucleic acid-binding protein
VLVRRRNRPASDVTQKLRWLVVGGLSILDVDESIALEAGRLRGKHYHRAKRPVSLADCVALATSLALGDRLATSDPALLAAATDEGCRTFPLPDARGRRAKP